MSAPGIVILALAVLGAGAGVGDTAADKKADRARVTVQDVFGTPDGSYVALLRTDREPYQYLPILIGQNEALALTLRLGHRTPERPLTLNLLDQVLKAGKFNIVEVAIYDQHDGVFFGRVRLRQAGRTVDLDARPSDALGLVAGTAVPIFVWREVLDAAGIGVRDLGPKGAPDNAQPSYDETL